MQRERNRDAEKRTNVLKESLDAKGLEQPGLTKNLDGMSENFRAVGFTREGQDEW
jgi:hypothetical protein